MRCKDTKCYLKIKLALGIVAQILLPVSCKRLKRKAQSASWRKRPKNAKYEVSNVNIITDSKPKNP
jgi:hypothetical protein